MRRYKNIFGALAVIPFLFVFATPAFAYLDPGAGSAILQGVLGTLAAIAVVLKLYWHRILKMLGLRKGIEDEPKRSSETGSEER